MEHDGCVGCKYENENPDSKYCMGCKQNAIDKYAPMTNADKIRNMSDEELAEFLVGLNEHCLAGIGKVDCSSCNGYCEDNCKRMTTNWLQSEVKGSDVDGKI